jgi:hypothetical protein
MAEGSAVNLMYSNEPINNLELTPDRVRKGDTVAIVGNWNGHRHHMPAGETMETYYFQIWTVAACGKKIMRLIREGGETLKHNVYIMEREGRPTFQSFICRPEDVEAMAVYLHATNRTALETTELIDETECRRRTAAAVERKRLTGKW